jgi:hypothetical protein
MLKTRLEKLLGSLLLDVVLPVKPNVFINTGDTWGLFKFFILFSVKVLLIDIIIFQ